MYNGGKDSIKRMKGETCDQIQWKILIKENNNQVLVTLKGVTLP